VQAEVVMDAGSWQHTVQLTAHCGRRKFIIGQNEREELVKIQPLPKVLRSICHWRLHNNCSPSDRFK
jgi:hypothetical protein